MIKYFFFFESINAFRNKEVIYPTVCILLLFCYYTDIAGMQICEVAATILPLNNIGNRYSKVCGFRVKVIFCGVES
jgi:hypothetical protein